MRWYSLSHRVPAETARASEAIGCPLEDVGKCQSKDHARSHRTSPDPTEPRWTPPEARIMPKAAGPRWKPSDPTKPCGTTLDPTESKDRAGGRQTPLEGAGSRRTPLDPA